MASVFYEYIQGEERDSLIEEMEMQCQWDELILMLEMVQRQAEINERRAELKVLQESGSYEDLTYLLEAGEQQAAQNQKGILQRIFEWFANMFNKLAGAFTKTKQQLSQLDPNAQLQIPEDYLNDSDAGPIGTACDALAKVNSMDTFKKVLLSGSIAALGGLLIYKKSKQQRDQSQQKTVNPGTPINSTNIWDAIHPKVQAAIAALKKLLESIPDATAAIGSKLGDTVSKAGNAIKNAASKVGQKPATDQNQGKTGETPSNNNQNQNGQNVNSSTDTEPMFYDDYYMSEANGVANAVKQGIDIVGEALQNPSSILTYLQKILTFIENKLSWFSRAAANVANNTTGAVSNVAAGAVQAAQNVQGNVQAANNLAYTGQVINNAVQNTGQNVNASADTEPIENTDKAIYESVFGESYVEVTEEDIVTNDLNKLILDL